MLEVRGWRLEARVEVGGRRSEVREQEVEMGVLTLGQGSWMVD